MKTKRKLQIVAGIVASVITILLLWCILYPESAFLPICNVSGNCCYIHIGILGNHTCLNTTGGGNGGSGTNQGTPTYDCCHWNAYTYSCTGNCNPGLECKYLGYGGDYGYDHDYARTTPICACIPPSTEDICENSAYPSCGGSCDQMPGYTTYCEAYYGTCVCKDYPITTMCNGQYVPTGNTNPVGYCQQFTCQSSTSQRFCLAILQTNGQYQCQCST